MSNKPIDRLGILMFCMAVLVVLGGCLWMVALTL